tara:strand:- start:981 stop:1385 length:405 start_codon:yes stop_codon:yes gene_type:complete
MVKTNPRKLDKVIIFVFCVFFSFPINSKHHKDLTGLKLICDLDNSKHAFEFIDKKFFAELTLDLENKAIEFKGDKHHYLTDKNYVYLERIDFSNQLFMRINRETLNINDKKEMGCIILKIPILEYLKKLKNELE